MTPTLAERLAELLPCPQHNRAVPGGALMVPLCLCDARDDLLALIETLIAEEREACAVAAESCIGPIYGDTAARRIRGLEFEPT